MLAELTQTLKALHLYGMATALAELQAERPRHAPSPEVWLKRLIEAEQVDRQTRSLKYQLRVAKFPLHRDFTGFDWRETALQGVLSRNRRNFRHPSSSPATSSSRSIILPSLWKV